MGGVRGRGLNWERPQLGAGKQICKSQGTGKGNSSVGLVVRLHRDSMRTQRSRREKQMQKCLGSGAVKRSICRRRFEQGREASGVTKRGWWLHGCLASEGPRWCPQGCALLLVVSQVALQRSLNFFLCLQLLCSPCSGVNKHQGDRGQAGTSCILL